MGDLSYQQTMVFDRLAANNEKLLAMNDAIRGRATFITAASTTIVGLISAAKLLPAGSAGEGLEPILLALIFICSVVIYVLAALIWKGGESALAGTSNIDVLYNDYISKEVDIAYANFLTDLCKAMSDNKQENLLRSRRLSQMIFAFIIQLLLLALSIGWASMSNLV